MHEIRFLGEVSIDVSSGAGTRQLYRPRSVALLAVLASTDGGGVTRDRLIALLWEDVDEARARHRLSNQLHVVRRVLGPDVILTIGEFVRLNPEAVRVDVTEFLRALASGDLERAAKTHAGPLLDGFYLSGAPEFEAWLEGERGALSTRALEVFEALADQEMERGKPARAVAWLQRATGLDPWNSRAAVALARALAASGDPGNGMQQLMEHVRRLEEDLGLEPDPDILALIENGQLGVRNGSLVTGFGTTGRPRAGSEAAQPAALSSVTVASSSPIRDRRLFARGPVSAVIMACALVVALGGLVSRVRGGEEAIQDRTLVLPIRAVGVDSSIAALATASLHAELADWDMFHAGSEEETEALRRRIGEPSGGAGLPESIRRVGIELGARKVIAGRVSRSEQGIEVTGSLIAIPGGEVLARGRASGQPDRLGAIVHTLVVEIAAQERDIPADRIATLSAQDPAAVRLFVQSHPHESEERDRLLREAFDRDSSFALAALELYESFEASFNTSDPSDPTAAATLAAWEDVAWNIWKNLDRLSPADRAYAKARLGWRFTDAHTARLEVAAWEQAVEAAPDRLAHWERLFDACYTYCSSYERSWRRPLLEVHDALLARGDSSRLELGMELALAAADTTRLRAYAEILPPDAWYGRWLAGIGLGRERERTAVLETMPELGDFPLMRIGNFSILTGLALEDAEQAAREPQRGWPGSIYALRQAVLARERGRHEEYRRLRDKMFQIFNVNEGLEALAAANVIAEWAAFGEPETDSILDSMERMLDMIISRDPVARPDTLAVAHCYRSWLRVERGDSTDVAESVRFLESEPTVRRLALARMCAPFLSLLMARTKGLEAYAKAAGRLHQTVRDRPITLGARAGTSYAELYVAAAANLELGRSFGELGYPETGVQVVERRPVAPANWGLYGFHIEFLREEARLLAQAGEAEAALARYQKYFQLRPEPPDLASWAAEWEAVRLEHEALKASQSD